MTVNENLLTQQDDDFGYRHTMHMSRTLKAKAIIKDKKMKREDNSAIQAANAALEVLSKEFKGWMENEIIRLENTFIAYVQTPLLARETDELFRAAHDLRGQASAYGYPLISDIAGSLSKMLDQLEKHELPLALVEHHINAIKIVYRDDIKDCSDKISLEVVNSLRLAIDHVVEARKIAS